MCHKCRKKQPKTCDCGRPGCSEISKHRPDHCDQWPYPNFSKPKRYDSCSESDNFRPPRPCSPKPRPPRPCSPKPRPPRPCSPKPPCFPDDRCYDKCVVIIKNQEEILECVKYLKTHNKKLEECIKSLKCEMKEIKRLITC
jgi:hypothetical protein